MLRSRRWLLPLCVSLHGIALHAQTTVIEYDQTKRVARLLYDGKPESRVYTDGRSIRVTKGAPIAVRVIHTNTALYDYKLTADKSPTPELGALTDFLGRLGPFAVDLASEVVPYGNVHAPAFAFHPRTSTTKATCQTLPIGDQQKLDADVLDACDAVEQALASLYGTFRGTPTTPGVTGVYLGSLRALEEMRDGVGLSQAVGSFESNYGGVFTTPGERRHLAYADSATVQLTVLRRVTAGLDGILTSIRERASHGGADDQALKLLQGLADQSRGAVDNADKAMAVLYAAERLGLMVLDAKDTITVDTLRITADTGALVKILVAPKKLAEAGRMARDEEFTMRLSVYRQLLLSPAVGLSFLYAEGAVFQKFGTATTPAGTVVTGGDDDQRFNWGLTLSLTPSFLDWRRSSGWAVWLLEGTINPTKDVKSLGIGSGLSWKFVKVGAGWVWTKHSFLDGGKAVGDTLFNKDNLATHSAYGRGEFYVSLSLVGLPPFVNK